MESLLVTIDLFDEDAPSGEGEDNCVHRNGDELWSELL
jgi:hypothetical protein